MKEHSSESKLFVWMGEASSQVSTWGKKISPNIYRFLSWFLQTRLSPKTIWVAHGLDRGAPSEKNTYPDRATASQIRLHWNSPFDKLFEKPSSVMVHLYCCASLKLQVLFIGRILNPRSFAGVWSRFLSRWLPCWYYPGSVVEKVMWFGSRKFRLLGDQ